MKNSLLISLSSLFILILMCDGQNSSAQLFPDAKTKDVNGNKVVFGPKMVTDTEKITDPAGGKLFETTIIMSVPSAFNGIPVYSVPDLDGATTYPDFLEDGILEKLKQEFSQEIYRKNPIADAILNLPNRQVILDEKGNVVYVSEYSTISCISQDGVRRLIAFPDSINVFNGLKDIPRTRRGKKVFYTRLLNFNGYMIKLKDSKLIYYKI